MNISITGNLGSGKSSICKLLKQKGYEVISAGGLFREIAIEHNMSVEDFNRKVNEDIKRGDRTVDDLIDQRTTKINAERENVVFDSRLAWNFASDSFKVFVMVDIEEAARRVWNDRDRSDSEVYESVEECRDGLANRQQLEKLRFKELYRVDYCDMGNYNLVIESTNISPEVAAMQILLRFEQYQKGLFTRMVELNPASIFPTKKLNQIMEDAEDTIDTVNTRKQITVGQVGGIWFVCEGHRKLLDACREKESLLEIRVKDILQPLLLSKNDYMEFEEVANIKYNNYPDEKILKRQNLLVFPSEET